VSVARFRCIVLCFALIGQSAAAQTNRPPASAPTFQVDVTPLEVVRSVAELVNDFGGGLMEGLLAGRGQRSAVIVAAQDDRVIATRTVGCCIASDARYAAGFQSNPFAAIAAMQLIEQQRLHLNDPVRDGGSLTVEDVLIHRADPALLRQLIQTASGSEFREYVSQRIIAPLTGGAAEPVPQVVGKLLVALLNDGMVEGRQIFAPPTAELMRTTRFTLHPALPGWTYGFAEMRRNGWRALQWDGEWSESPASEARMVVVPDADIAYFILVEGHPGSAFWRTLDDALFERIFRLRTLPAVDVEQTPAPTVENANAIAGVYEADAAALSSAAPLKNQGMRLAVRAQEDGSLILRGAENAVLAPRPGGYWAAEGGNLDAAARDGRLILSSGLYRPLRIWKRPALYGSLALLFGLAAGGAFYGERRAKRRDQGQIGIALLGAAAGLLAAASFAWHVSPVLG
jgi:CubicO group peptidase (beta-lactamase class C family)